MRLEKLLYHGTARALAESILRYGFELPIYLTENKEAAVHYARAAAAYVEAKMPDVAKGYSVFTLQSLPRLPRPDDYSEGEKGQWVLPATTKTKRLYLNGQHTWEHFDLIADESERLRLQCFAIGMWSR